MGREDPCQGTSGRSLPSCRQAAAAFMTGYTSRGSKTAGSLHGSGPLQHHEPRPNGRRPESALQSVCFVCRALFLAAYEGTRCLLRAVVRLITFRGLSRRRHRLSISCTIFLLRLLYGFHRNCTAEIAGRCCRAGSPLLSANFAAGRSRRKGVGLRLEIRDAQEFYPCHGKRSKCVPDLLSPRKAI